MQNKYKFFWQWFNCILLTVTISFTTTVTAAEIFQRPPVIKKAPNLSLLDLASQKQQLNQYLGKVVLLHFWATWCGSCIQELSTLQTLWEKLQDKGLVVIAVAADNRTAVEAFTKEHIMTFPVWIDQYGKGLRAYGLKGFPTTYLIGRTGNLEGIALGPREWTNFSVFNDIKTLVTKP